MRSDEARPQPLHRCLMKCAALALCILVCMPLLVAQQAPAAHTDMPFLEDFKKYPGLQEELVQLQTRLKQDVRFPADRSQSRLLPLLPEGTIFYAALPNYGDALHQALTVFQHELDQSTALRDWWQHGEFAANGPKFMDSMEKFCQFSQYLGEEIVVAGTVDDRTDSRKDPRLLILAEVQKPGLKDFLKQSVKEFSDKSHTVRVLDVREDAQELAAAKDVGTESNLVILVRSDYVLASLNVASLRRFNEQLDKGSREFASTEFGQRVSKGYEHGASIVGAADLQTVVGLIPQKQDPGWKLFQNTGFADAKYLVWEHKGADGQPASQTELSFIAKRRGVASWLSAPGPMGSLDFISPKAVMVGAGLLKNPAEIFDDIAALVSASNPNALAAVAQMEQGLHLSLKGDVLSRLRGEIAWEVDTLAPTGSAWKVILRVNDPDLLQAALTKLLAGPQVGVEQAEDGGLIYNTLQVPSGAKPTEVSYVFVDGYMVIASGRALAADAVRLHKSGESLAKSESFLAALPPGQPKEVSALFYEDPMAMVALTMRQASPQMAELLSQTSTKSAPIVMSAYGEDSAIRWASKSIGVDAGGMMIVAAIAIPNLIRARTAANEGSAVGSLRTINTGQVMYTTTYPARGYARDLASLGPGLREPVTPSPLHAGVLDSALGNASCTAGAWCTKSGYRFMISTACKTQPCVQYVAIATPVTSSSGTRNFCSTSDAVIRTKPGPPLTAPITPLQCRAWAPLK